MFQRIHWIFISPDDPTKIKDNICLHIKVHCAVIEYENGKAKAANYLIQLVDLDDPNYQQQEWFSEWQEVVGNLTLRKVIDFYNVCHQMGTLIEQERTLIHCGNTIFFYCNDFIKYMEVEGASLERIFDYVWCRSWQTLIRKRKEISSWIIWKMESKTSLTWWRFWWLSRYDGLEDVIGDESM